MVRKSKQAKRSPEISISGTDAAAAQPTDEPPRSTTLGPPLSVHKTSSNLVQSSSQFRNDRLPYNQQTDDDSLLYTRTVLAGAESLEVEMTPLLRRNLGDRRGQVYHMGPFPERTFRYGNNFNGVAASCDTEGFMDAQGHHEAVGSFELEDYWGNDYSGIGHQFADCGLERTRHR
jgi:hypothetical protein